MGRRRVIAFAISAVLAVFQFSAPQRRLAAPRQGWETSVVVSAPNLRRLCFRCASEAECRWVQTGRMCGNALFNWSG